MLTLDKIYDASRVLQDVIHPTSVVKASAIDVDCDLYLKPECLQLTGSFKLRGSGYKISQLTDEEKDWYRRGRNSKPHTKAKNASTMDYLEATGFEAVMGYLYLTGDMDRICELVNRGINILGLDILE